MTIMNFSGRVLKNLFSRPATTKYPLVPKKYPEATRGHIRIDIGECIFCGMCERKCPVGVIRVDRAERNWQIDRFGCIQCGECVSVCPKKCLYMENKYAAPGTRRHSDHFHQEEKKKQEEGK